VAADVLIIDNIGMLSSLYQYANFAWIGGAYGKGLHNTLEAATFGLPIFFGNKKYQKFQEALDLEAIGGAKVIPNSAAFQEALSTLYDNPSIALSTSNDIIAYVQQNLGSTEKVITLTKKIGIN
jgi:3-deoxy-D-manno-octulosonic-acid transferase